MRGMQSRSILSPSSILNPSPQPRPESNQEPHLPDRSRERASQYAPRPASIAPPGEGDHDSNWQPRGAATAATSLAAMNEAESDGRPAWLRRWTTEVRRDIAVERDSAKKDSAPTAGEDRLPHRDGLSADGLSAFDTGREPHSAETYTHGYKGQSIEAAFNFETPNQFATGFEAEATEDRLSLSGDAPSGADSPVRATASAAPDVTNGSTSEAVMGSAAGWRGIERLDSRSLAPGEEAGQDVESGSAAQPVMFPDSLPRLDPQAVRAAIFRLAQEAPTSRSAAAASGAVSGAVSPQAQFADVAFDLWRDSEATRKDRFEVVAEQNSSEPERSEDLATSPVALDADRHAAETLRLTSAEADALAQRQHRSEPADERDLPDVEEERLARSTELRRVNADATEMSETEPTFAPSNLQQWADSSAGAVPAPETPSHRPNECSHEACENSGIDSRLNPSRILAGDASFGARNGTAADAPALAHDAGNLLSALTLYSELLALSGVLHARHKHYAQDLKLLATRSEVLISRLLASCSAAESKAHSLMQENALGLAAAPGTIRAVNEPTLPEADAARPADTPDADPQQADLEVSAQEETSVEAAANSRHQGEGGIEQATPLTSSLPRLEKVDEALPTGTDEAAPLILADLLTGWRSLLSIIGRGSIEVNFGPHASLPIRVKEDAMERILVNLVHNAMTATRGGGSIRIGVGRIESPRSPREIPSSDGWAQTANRLVLTVDDSGCGMSNEQIAQILAGTASSPNDGSSGNRFRRGLGLQIVRELVASSGGELAIYSREGAGTRIEMAWPTVESEALPARRPPASARFSPASLRSEPGQDHHAPQPGEAPLLYTGSASWRTADSTANDLKGAIAC